MYIKYQISKHQPLVDQIFDTLTNYFLLFQIAGGWTTNGKTYRVSLLNIDDFDNGWYAGKYKYEFFSPHFSQGRPHNTK